MTIRSIRLFQYLQQTNKLNASPDALRLAKLEYRRLYKKQWKQRVQPIKEIRYTVTLTQFELIQTKANGLSIKPNTYAKNIVLEYIGQPVKNEALLDVLQMVSMAVIALDHNVPLFRIKELMSRAETKLLQYLKM